MSVPFLYALDISGASSLASCSCILFPYISLVLRYGAQVSLCLSLCTRGPQGCTRLFAQRVVKKTPQRAYHTFGDFVLGLAASGLDSLAFLPFFFSFGYRTPVFFGRGIFAY